MSENVIIEVDLAIHPYQGIIGCFQDKWTGWLEPGFIFYLPRDSPITYDIYPGEYILCKKEPIYECDMGHVLMPIKKLTSEEIFELINSEPKIKIFEWDTLTEKVTVLNIAKRVFQALTKLEQKNTLTNSQVKKLAQDFENLFQIPNVNFLYPEVKLKALDLVLDRLNQDYFDRIMKQLTKYGYQLYDYNPSMQRSYYYRRESKKAGTLSLNELLALLFPEIRLAIKAFNLDFSMVETFNRIIANENTEREKYEELKLEVMSKLEQFIANTGTSSFNIEWFKSVYFEELKKRVLDIRVSEINDTEILFTEIKEDGQTKKQYNIGNLRGTYMGKRLLESLKIANSIEWIDVSMFNLISAALRKFKVELKIKKQK